MRILSALALLLAAPILAAPVLEPLPVARVAAEGLVFRQSFSRDGQWVAEDIFVTSASRKSARLRHLKTGQIISLGEAGHSAWAPVWSPDGQKVAYFQNDRGDAVLYIRSVRGEVRKVEGVMGVPVSALSEGNAPIWFPDSQRLATLVTPEHQDTPEEGYPVRLVPFAQVGAGEPEVTVYGGDSPSSLPSPPCGASQGRCDLAVVDLRTGVLRRLASGIRGGLDGISPLYLSADGNVVAYYDRSTDDPDFSRRNYGVYAYELTACEVASARCTTTAPMELNVGRWFEQLPISFASISWAKQLQVLGPLMPGRKMQASRDARLEYELGESRVVRWKSTEGGSSAGSLLLPPRYEPGRRLPLVVWNYPNDRGSERGFHALAGTVYDFQILATRGYAVLYPDAPTRAGTPGKDVLDAVQAGVDAVIEQGYADPQRLAIMGCSAGSSTTLFILTRTTRFGAAEISCSVTIPDLPVAYLYTGPAVPADQVGAYYEQQGGNETVGGTPWSNPEGYRANSSLALFDRIRTPVLMIKGERDGDERVASDIIFLGLRKVGVPVEYRIYRDEGHTLIRPANVVDAWNRRLEFFARHLDLQLDDRGAVMFDGSRAMERSRKAGQ